MISLGVDIGFSRQVASTGICVVSPLHTTPIRCVHVRTDRTLDAIQELLGNERPTSISIDGPLVPGKKRGVYNIIDGYRSCERLLSGGIFQRRCKPGPTNSPRGQALHRQATKVAIALSAAFPKAPIHEAFPNAFLGVMMSPNVFRKPIRRGIKSDVFWQAGIKNKVLHRLLVHLYRGHAPKLVPHWEKINNHDERAAFICALTARAVETRSSLLIEGDGDGAFALPPRSFVQRWALAALCERIPTLN